MRRSRVLLPLVLIGPAAAFVYGGWSVTTVDEVPEFTVAGKPFDVTYTVRQHGFTLLNDLHGTVSAHAGQQGRSVSSTFLGAGRYRAAIVMPSAGTWDVRIDNGFGNNGTSFTVKAIEPNAVTPSPVLPIDRGRQLFATKGCVSCHTHQLMDKAISSRIGPDLSEPKFTSAYLSRFLANPDIKKDWKNDARMPNLGLKPSEIVALIAFLNQEGK